MAVEGSGLCPTLTGLHGAMGPPVGTADTICSFAYELFEKGFLRFYFLGAGFIKGGVSALAVDAREGNELAAASDGSFVAALGARLSLVGTSVCGVGVVLRA